VNFGVTEAIRAAGMRPGTMQIAVHTEAASEQVGLDLDLAVGDPVVVLERVRTADGRPVVFSRDIVSTRRVSSSEVARMPVDGSLYDVLEHLGYAVANGVVTIEPTVTDRTLVRLLKGKVGVPILFLRQVDFDQNGDPVLLSEEHHLAEAFEFTVVRRGPGRRAS
jgi:GntR family transcriptional regulator